MSLSWVIEEEAAREGGREQQVQKCQATKRTEEMRSGKVCINVVLNKRHLKW